MNWPTGASGGSVPWSQAPPAWPADEVRSRIRELRQSGRRMLVALDDDPTGSQAVHDMQIVLVTDPVEYRLALAEDEAASCFVLTNTRSLTEADAAELNRRVAGDLFGLAVEQGAPIDLVSRSDSTLRGHVWAEIQALCDARREAMGRGYDGVLFAPAYPDAGRVTADDVHWARVGSEWKPVAETEFSRDATFGYSSSNLREFVAEASRGAVRPEDVQSLSLHDIRTGGAERVAEVLSGVRDLQFVVVNALERADLDVVALGALLAEQRGRALLYRSGPALVAALHGQEPAAPLSPQTINSRFGATGYRPGLVVVGSHVGQTSRQLEVLRSTLAPAEVVLDVRELLALEAAARTDYVADRADQVVAAAATGDVLLCTSREVVTGREGVASLSIARAVSDALSETVSRALRAGFGWVVAKGGITSHDVALRGLRMRRAEVLGQLFPGVVSVFAPIDADPLVVGRPYIVFAGNVGTVDSLAEVVRRLRAGSRPSPSPMTAAGEVG